MEHHANIVPWQMLAERKGVVIKFARMKDNIENQVFDMDHFKSLLTEKTKFVSIQHASNVLATCNPVEEIIEAALEGVEAPKPFRVMRLVYALTGFGPCPHSWPQG